MWVACSSGRLSSCDVNDALAMIKREFWPGHVKRLQTFSSTLSPSHRPPPRSGGGLLHCRLRVVTDGPASRDVTVTRTNLSPQSGSWSRGFCLGLSHGLKNRRWSLSEVWSWFLSVCSAAVLDPSIGHTTYVLPPFISVLCHSDWLFHGESCPRLDVVHPGCAWSSSPACTWQCSLLYLFLQATPLISIWRPTFQCQPVSTPTFCSRSWRWSRRWGGRSVW